MKKKLLISILLLITCSTLIGCSEKNKEKKLEDYDFNSKTITNWEINKDISAIEIPEEAKKAYDSSIQELNNLNLTPIAYLANKDNVSFLFLCKETNGDNISFKAVTITNGSITNSKVFEYDKYADKNKKGTQEEIISDGWIVTNKNGFANLDEKTSQGFNIATSKLDNIIYTPIALLAKDIKDPNHIVMLCIEMSYETAISSIKILTMDIKSEDPKITYNAFIDLQDLTDII